jgi:phospholipase/carboxylesterase
VRRTAGFLPCLRLDLAALVLCAYVIISALIFFATLTAHGYDTMNECLPAIELETAPNPEFSIIWMHGLGADGNDFAPIVPELGLPSSPGVRFVFPHAPMIPVTWNNGFVMRAWYDIKVADNNSRHADEPGIRASCAAVRQLIARENERGVPTRNIILAGFSQGAAMAYTAGLTHPDTLAGIVALSAYLPSPELLAKEFSDANRDTPIFAAHGSDDAVLPLALGIDARDSVQQYGCAVAWHTYRMAHAVCQEEIVALGAWLAQRLTGSATRKN